MRAGGKWRAIWTLGAEYGEDVRPKVDQVDHGSERDDSVRHGPIGLAHIERETNEEKQQRDVQEHGEDRHDKVDFIVIQSDAPVVADERAPLRRSGDVALVLLDDPSAWVMRTAAMASTCSHCLTTTAPNAANRLKIRLRNQQRLIQGLGVGDGGGRLNEATSLTRGLFAQAR